MVTTDFPFRIKPLTNITPFTYRDGMTYLELLYSLRGYVTESLVPQFDNRMARIIAEFNAGIANAETTIIATREEWQAIFDAYTADVTASLMALNDAAMSELVNQPDSQTSNALEALFAPASLAELAETGRLSQLALDNAYAAKSVQATIENGRLSQESLNAAFASNTTQTVVESGRLSVNELDEAYAAKSVQATIENGRLSQDEINRDNADLVNRAYSVQHVRGTNDLPEHFFTTLRKGAGIPYGISRAIGGNSTDPVIPLETVDTFYARTKASVISSGSGVRLGGPNEGQNIGLSIFEGQLIKGWDDFDGEDRGRESVVFMRDGSLKIYDETTPPEQIIADGGWNSFSWGSAVYRDGQITDFLSYLRYQSQLSGRQLVGDLFNGDLFLLTFPGKTDVSGANGYHMIDAVAGMGVKNMYVLDGGGSAQLMINGAYVVPSSDATPRPISDVLYFYASPASSIPNPNFTDLPTINSTGTAQYRFDGRSVEVIVSLEGDFIDGVTQIFAAGTIPESARPHANRRGGLGTSGSFPGVLSVSSDGSGHVIQRSGSSRSNVSGSVYYTVD